MDFSGRPTRANHCRYLSEVACSWWGGPMNLVAEAGQTYYFQFGSRDDASGCFSCRSCWCGAPTAPRRLPSATRSRPQTRRWGRSPSKQSPTCRMPAMRCRPITRRFHRPPRSAANAAWPHAHLCAQRDARKVRLTLRASLELTRSPGVIKGSWLLTAIPSAAVPPLYGSLRLRSHELLTRLLIPLADRHPARLVCLECPLLTELGL